MGQEATCEVQFSGKVSSGKALLETDSVIFRGEFRLSIPLKDITSVEARDGKLHLSFPQGEAVFGLGPQAEKWALKIRNPRTRMDKLGVKPGAVVALLGLDDKDFRAELEARAVHMTDGAAAENTDLIFLLAEDRTALERLKPLPRHVKANGSVWVVYPKGQRQITESDVLNAGREAGLVDVKVASFSASQTALKFVIPVARR